NPRGEKPLWAKTTFLVDKGRYKDTLLLIEKAAEYKGKAKKNKKKRWASFSARQRQEVKQEKTITDLANDPSAPRIGGLKMLIVKARALNGLHRYKVALDMINKRFEDNKSTKGNAEMWLYKGDALYGLHRYVQSLRSYDRALSIDPRNVEAWIKKGDLSRTLGRFTEAIVAYDKAISIDSGVAKAWYAKASLLDIMGMKKEAEECHAKAVGLDPSIAGKG
ncbi:MAG: tetratricopeptide repeat protein, partial [Candidatus Bathyanammoxibius sp.]